MVVKAQSWLEARIYDTIPLFQRSSNLVPILKHLGHKSFVAIIYMEGNEDQPVVIAPKGEHQELDKVNLAPFLGGLFSVGGMMSLVMQNETQRRKLRDGQIREYPGTRIRPVIEYSDNRPEKIERLKRIFGGRITPHSSRDSFKWSVTDHEAVRLAFAMRDFSPPRGEAIDAFQQWAGTVDKATRIQIAQQLREKTQGKPKILPKESYTSLIEDPSFLAGVFESRGLIYTGIKDGKSVAPHILINTENQGLIEAIRERYGGGITNVTESARVLTLAQESARNVLRLITPYLISPLSEYQQVAA